MLYSVRGGVEPGLGGSIPEEHGMGGYGALNSAGTGRTKLPRLPGRPASRLDFAASRMWPHFASPAASSLGSFPARPPAAARAAGEATGLDGSEIRKQIGLNVLVPDCDSARQQRNSQQTPRPNRQVRWRTQPA